MGCSNDSEKPLNKRAKNNKSPSKNPDNNILNIRHKNKNKKEKEDEIGNSINSDNNSNNDDNNNDNYEEEKSQNEEDNNEVQNAFLPNFQPYLQSKNDPSFNFPEVKENKYVGKGLKKMKGYISNISEEELKKKREAFWGTRVEGNKQTWHFLKEICEMPEAEENDLEAMLKAYDFTPYKNCINVSYDALGALYEIPNYCIHNPMVYDLPEDNKKKPNEKKIKFKARNGIKNIKLKSSNYSTVKKTKMSIAKKLGTTYDKIRLFFSGKEMKNDSQLWNYNVDNDVVIMIMVLP